MTGGHQTCPLRARHRDNHLIVMTGLLPDYFRSPASVHSPVCFHLCDTEFRLQCVSLSALFLYSKLCNEPVSLYMLFFFFFAANRESEIPHYMVSNRVCHHALWCMWNHLCWEKKEKMWGLSRKHIKAVRVNWAASLIWCCYRISTFQAACESLILLRMDYFCSRQ